MRTEKGFFKGAPDTQITKFRVESVGKTEGHFDG